MKEQIYSSILRNTPKILDYLFYSITDENKTTLENSLDKCETLEQVEDFEASFNQIELPRTSSFKLKMQHQILMKKRRLET